MFKQGTESGKITFNRLAKGGIIAGVCFLYYH